MQKIATDVFIISSICFGIIGLSLIITGNFGPNQSDNVEPGATLISLLFTCVFLILPSFAVSIAGKYLVDKS
jgi:hypothetical protein